jgi:uncharacterized protein (TIGR02453 family)
VPAPFTKKSLAFLRALKRNNDRDWFRARKADYEQHLRSPMIELLARLASDLPAFAPDLVADPRVSLFRIYRDTRFSADKAPLKTNIAAHMPSRRLPKGVGAGLYFEVAPRWVWIGGGSYRPDADELRAFRSSIAERHRSFSRIVHARTFVETAGGLDGEQLTRVPRGYATDHPAAAYLKHKQFIAGREFPAEFALEPRFYAELLGIFRAIAPLVAFLNAAMVKVP